MANGTAVPIRPERRMAQDRAWQSNAKTTWDPQPHLRKSEELGWPELALSEKEFDIQQADSLCADNGPVRRRRRR
ncbi:jg13036 [Pararge aegeria aegeria]|uniref:Jg13036 protein n=1 Tax=Pararge aegeria aegeria TaxID=348720 RepID=A0A8S4RPG2_9NEOP|nr:jg13036 [Pararge aegeria aegeria]